MRKMSKERWIVIWSIFLLVIAVVLTISTKCEASDFSFLIKGGGYSPVDDELNMGWSLQGQLQWKVIYLFGEVLQTDRRIAGQAAGTNTIYGFGLGLNVPVHKYVSLWGQFGYFIPSTDLEGTWGPLGSSTYSEAIWLHWKRWGQKYGYNVCPYTGSFRYKISPAVGGALGLNLKYPLTKHLDVGFDAGYNFMRFRETFYAMTPTHVEGGPGLIESYEHKDFSGFNFGLKAEWRF